MAPLIEMMLSRPVNQTGLARKAPAKKCDIKTIAVCLHCAIRYRYAKELTKGSSVSLIKRIQAWDSQKRTKAGQMIADNFTVDAAERFVSWYDHGFLRRFWSNLHPISEGVYRSNYPNGKRFKELSELGIKVILNLRGGEGTPTHMLEKHYCQQYGIDLHTINLNARYAPDAKELLRLLDLFDSVQRPFLMHCKSGADRAGLASSLYLIHVEGKGMAEAKKMLSLRFLHVNDRKTGIMGHLLRAFEAANAARGISLRDWIATEYDAEAEQKAFEASRKN